jgi:hypothetical protein
MLSCLEHDPEKACPALDAGWLPVFGQDHAHNSSDSTILRAGLFRVNAPRPERMA